MSTIVNTPNGNNDNGSAGWIIAIVAVVVILLLAFFLLGNDADDARDTVQDLPAQVENRVQNIDVPAPVVNTFSTTTVNSTTTNP